MARSYTRDTDLTAMIDSMRYGQTRRWLEQELVKIPCRCPVCGRRTDLSRAPDVQQAIAITRIANGLTSQRQERLAEIVAFFADKLATRGGAVLVFCDRCTLADLHRQHNSHRTDYCKKQPSKRRRMLLTTT